MKHTFAGALLLGIGIIGMIDGIVFHQILQWHSTYMHTGRFFQIVSDGFFHALVTVIVFAGAVVLWKSDPEDETGTNRTFISGFLLGAGLFNFIEGIVDHHLLQIHHVKPGEHQFHYDLAFDLAGLLLIVLGLAAREWRVKPKGTA